MMKRGGMMDKTPTKTIIEALRILAYDIESPDGVASMAILQAADRLELLDRPEPIKVNNPDNYWEKPSNKHSW